MWLLLTPTWAAEIELTIPLAGRIGEPLRGAWIGTVELPSRLRRPEEVTTEADGFTLTCRGRGRVVEVRLAFDLAAFPARAPVEWECTVGGHTLVVHTPNDHAVAWRQADHPTFRLGEHHGHGFRLGPGWTDAPGRVIDARHQRVGALACRVEDEVLVVEYLGEATPGVYRCVVEGRAPVPFELLPATDATFSGTPGRSG